MREHGPVEHRKRGRRGAPSRTARRARAGCLWSCLWLAACGGTQPPPPRSADPSAERPADDLGMRDPGARPELDTALAPVAVDADAPVPTAAPEAPEPQEQAPDPIPVEGGRRSAVALRDRAFALPGGLVLHGVPANARVWTREDDDVWEVSTQKGRLLVLIRATSLSRLARPERSLLGSTKPVSARVARDGWGPRAVEVVVDRFTSDTHAYTIERRAVGTDWVAGGIELASPTD